MLPYQLIRSDKRKTIGLQVKHGKVIVRAPYFVDQLHITKLINNKSAWLQKKITEQLSSPIRNTPTFLPNSSLYIFGKAKSIQINYSTKAGIENTEHALIINITQRLEAKLADEKMLTLQIKKQLDLWFKEQVNSYIDTHLANFCERCELFPHSFQVKRYKSRWGSCNSKKELSFSSLLAMVPNWVFDYVIVHELCHLKHMNHSAKFWALVYQHDTNYKKAKQWLKLHQTNLQW
jgi:predicted metal-dependent hydrolase